jgi:hypothetical protein
MGDEEENGKKNMAHMVPIYRIHHEFGLASALSLPRTWPITFCHVSSTFDYLGGWFFLLPTK